MVAKFFIYDVVKADALTNLLAKIKTRIFKK